MFIKNAIRIANEGDRLDKGHTKSNDSTAVISGRDVKLSQGREHEGVQRLPNEELVHEGGEGKTYRITEMTGLIPDCTLICALWCWLFV